MRDGRPARVHTARVYTACVDTARVTRLRDRAIARAYRSGSVLARVVPERAGLAIATTLGRALRHGMRSRAAQSRRHLVRASRGELSGAALDAAVAGAFASYGRYWYELFRLPHVTGPEIEARFDLEGYEHIAAGLERGKGVVLALPHLGGWEWAGAWFAAAHGRRPFVVVEAIEPAELFEWFRAVRHGMGMDMVAHDDGAATKVLAALRANRVVCLVADRDLAGDGVEVEFFGERTTLPGGPALLALRSGAPLLVVGVYFAARGGHHAHVSAPLDTARRGSLRADVARVTQDVAHEFERLIGAAPEQWHLLQPNWPSDHDHGGAP